MAGRNVSILGISFKSKDIGAFARNVRNALLDLESQLNSRPAVNSRNDERVPEGSNRNDLLISFKKGKLQIGIFDGKRARYLNASDLGVLLALGTQFKGIQTGTAAPTIATNFPNINDWGFYDRTAGAPGLYICYHRPSTGTLSALLL